MNNEYQVSREWYDKYVLKKPEYGTPEYWVKERKSRFIRDARKKEDGAYKMGSGIITLWSKMEKTELPLYQMYQNMGNVYVDSNENTNKWTLRI